MSVDRNRRYLQWGRQPTHMNYLGHLLLAGDDPDDLVGNLMGDFVKGPVDDRVPARYRPGVVLHRRIDSFTDGHASVGDARRRMDPRWRRFSGIIIDMWFDHLLARRWSTLHGQRLEAFAAGIYDLLRTRWDELPESMKLRMGYTIDNDLLVGYRDPDFVGRAMVGVGRRLRRPVDLAQAAGPLIRGDLDLGEEFSRFLPDALRFATRQRRVLAEPAA